MAFLTFKYAEDATMVVAVIGSWMQVNQSRSYLVVGTATMVNDSFLFCALGLGRVSAIRQSKSHIRQCIRHWAYIRYY